MLFVLGIGSNIAMCSCIVTAIRDQFPRLKPWQTVIPVALVGFTVGLMYTTPVCSHRAHPHTFNRFHLHPLIIIHREDNGHWHWSISSEHHLSYLFWPFLRSLLSAGFMVCCITDTPWMGNQWTIIVSLWIGVNRICRDIEFMLNRKTGLYWRLCWGLLTPLMLIVILLYTFGTYSPVTYSGHSFPTWAYGEAYSKFISDYCQQYRKLSKQKINDKIIEFPTMNFYSNRLDNQLPRHHPVAIVGLHSGTEPKGTWMPWKVS